MNATDTQHIVVIGLGYVGLPLAVALAKHFPVTGLDIDPARISELRSGRDRTNEVQSDILTASSLKLSDAPSECAGTVTI